MGGRAYWLALLLFVGFAPQGLAGDEISYVRRTRFPIPFFIDPADQARVKEVQLYLSDDLGRSWRIHKVANPQEKDFPFQTDRDGQFWFIIRTLSTDGQLQPPSLDGRGPDLRVAVDTRPPQITLQPLPPQGDLVGVAWDILDENLDLNSLVLEARPAGGDWRAIDIERQASGRKYWAPGGRSDLDVRLRAKDKADNANTGFTNLGASRGAMPQSQGYESNPNRGASPTSGSGLPNVIYVNHTDIQFKFQLEEVGPSGISTVDFYYTKDGQKWSRYGDDASREPAVQVQDLPDNVKLVKAKLPGEGPYGVILQARSGVGMGAPAPQRGDRPMLWVEVDLTKPTVQFLGALASRGPDGTLLTINWKANDKHLDQGPISLSYAERAEGPWLPIEKNLDNTGRFVWRVPSEAPFRFFVRIEARDRANNVGLKDSDKPVAVDLTQPRIKLLGIEPAGGGSGGISVVPPE